MQIPGNLQLLQTKERQDQHKEIISFPLRHKYPVGGTYERTKWIKTLLYLLLHCSQTPQIRHRIASPISHLRYSPRILHPSPIKLFLYKDFEPNLHHPWRGFQHLAPLQLQPAIPYQWWIQTLLLIPPIPPNPPPESQGYSPQTNQWDSSPPTITSPYYLEGANKSLCASSSLYNPKISHYGFACDQNIGLQIYPKVL